MNQEATHTKKEFAEAIYNVERLYPNMAVMSKVSTLLKDMDSNLQDVSKYIRTDPALTAEIIRISNTAYYAGTTRCSDINTSLLRIGFREAMRAINIIIASDFCSRDLTKYGITADEFWLESLTVSVIAEQLAMATGQDASEAATIGIIHSIGRVVIDNILEDFRVDILWDPSIPVHRWENAIVGYDYAEAGARLLERWDFPVDTISVVRHQLEPDTAIHNTLMQHTISYALKLSKLTGPGVASSNFDLPIGLRFPKQSNITAKGIYEALGKARRTYLDITNYILGD